MRPRSEYHIYHDNQGNAHKLTNADLRDAVILRNQLVMASGHCNFHRLRRLMIADGIDKHSLKVCPGFRNLVKKYNYRYVLNNDSSVDSPKQHNFVQNKALPYSIKNRIGQLNYAKRESQDYARGFNKLRRHVTDTQILRDQVSKALSKAHFDFKVKPTLNRKTIDALNQKTMKSDNALLVSFSDLHVGAIVNIPQNQYNVKIAEKRVSEYARRVVKLTKINNVSDVYIANLGDCVENVYMRFTQGFDTQLSMSEQIVEAINIVDGLLVYLYNKFVPLGIKLHYTGIGGNHDRLNGNKRNSIYKDNVMVIINAAVKRLAQLKFNSTFFEYIKPDNIYRTHLKINHDNIKLVHGDLDNLSNPNILGEMSVNDNRNYKLLLGGHKHRAEMIESGLNKYVVTAGSFKGPDDYSSKLGRVSSVSQMGVVIDPTGVMTIQNIELN